jgi:nucleoside-diphosphate-sugar epimerase
VTESSSQRVAVVGAKSQIGEVLLPRLATAGYVPYRIRREHTGSADGITTYIFHESDCTFIPHLDFVGTVISLAPLPSIEVVVKMAQALRAKRIIAFGSTGRFSKVGSTSLIEQDFVLQQERAEMLFSKRCEELDIGWTLFRPTMIYGADADQNVTFIKSMIAKFGFFPIPVGAKGLRQPVHVDDLAKACVSALRCEATVNKAYNLGGGEALGFPELVKRIFKAEGKRPLVIPVPKAVFLLMIEIAKKFPKLAFVRKEMVERMFQDLTADNQAAIEDFEYAPRPFCLKKSVPNRGGAPNG